jgi:hypothetical protein
MNLSYLAATADVSFSFPSWILWGVAFAVVLTLGVGLLMTFVSSLDGSWLSLGDSPAIKLILAVFFVLYGLVPGLAGSATWFYLNWLAGLVVGIATFVVIWVIHMRIEYKKDKQRYSVPRFVPPEKPRRGNSSMPASFRD